MSPTDKFRAVAYRVASESIRRVKVDLTLDNYEEELTKVGGRQDILSVFLCSLLFCFGQSWIRRS